LTKRASNICFLPLYVVSDEVHVCDFRPRNEDDAVGLGRWQPSGLQRKHLDDAAVAKELILGYQIERTRQTFIPDKNLKKPKF
jgi:hypothetical protein